MNLIASTTRTALKIARLPADAALSLVGRRGPAGQSARASVDRVDAAVRDTVGRATGDEQLKGEARLGNAAADERTRAADFQEAAAKKKAAAKKRRTRAAATADTQRSEAGQRAQARKRDVEQEAAAERKQQRDREERERLAQLEAEQAALDEREDALQAKDEAQRLEAAAGAAKAQRKAGT